MVPESQKTDALAGMTLIESLATVSTMGLFGAVFSYLVNLDKAYLTFYLNAVSSTTPLTISLWHFLTPT